MDLWIGKELLKQIQKDPKKVLIIILVKETRLFD